MNVSDFVTVNTYIDAGGLPVANFGITQIFVEQAELKEGQTWDANTRKLFSGLPEVAQYFDVTSQAYKMAESYFGSTANRLYIYLVETDKDMVLALSEARAQANGWFYHYMLPKQHQLNAQTTKDARAWADANVGFYWHTMPSIGHANHDALVEAIRDDGIRRANVLYRQGITDASTDDGLFYDCIAGSTLFSSIDYTGTATNVSMEFKSVAGVTPDELTTEQAEFCRTNRVTCYVIIHNADVAGAGEYRYTVTNSPQREVVGSVINVDVINSGLQTAAHSFLKSKIPVLDQIGQSLLIDTVAAAMDKYLTARVIKAGYIPDIKTGVKAFAPLGYKVYTLPEDIDNRTEAEIADDKFAPINLSYLIAVGGRAVVINTNVYK
jgi:hypothetical protein